MLGLKRTSAFGTNTQNSAASSQRVVPQSGTPTKDDHFENVPARPAAAPRPLDPKIVMKTMADRMAHGMFAFGAHGLAVFPLPLIEHVQAEIKRSGTRQYVIYDFAVRRMDFFSDYKRWCEQVFARVTQSEYQMVLDAGKISVASQSKFLLDTIAEAEKNGVLRRKV